MPLVFLRGGLRFFFFSDEGLPREPPHVHVKGGGSDAKVWLEPEISVAESYGFSSAQLVRILATVSENRELLLEAWHDHFS